MEVASIHGDMPLLTVTLTDFQIEDLRAQSAASGVPIAEIVRRALWPSGRPKMTVEQFEERKARVLGTGDDDQGPETRMKRTAAPNAFLGRGGAVPKPGSKK